MPRKLTFLFWDIKNNNKKVHTALECLSTSNGRATILNLLNTNQIYNLYFKSFSYVCFIMLSTLKPINTHVANTDLTQGFSNPCVRAVIWVPQCFYSYRKGSWTTIIG